MTVIKRTTIHSGNRGIGPSKYQKATILDLARDIFHQADRNALRELHDNRTLFNSSTNGHVVMAEFLLELKSRDIAFQWCGRDSVAVGLAYDLTLAKFLNLPPGRKNGLEGTADDSPDCRYYYKAFHDYVNQSLQKQPAATIIEIELRSAEVLQGMVTRHFYLSCLESRRRSMKLVRRYRWRVKGYSLTVWLPVQISGQECRTWLETNVGDVDPSRPGERERIQAVIDRLWARRRILSLDRLSQQEQAVSADNGLGRSFTDEAIDTHGLAGFVAQEKAENIADQRPTIRDLGPSRLKNLVTTVFESIAEDRYHAERIAGEYDLSKATFSRFAGSRWASDDDTLSDRDIPDLWRNTAHVLASHDDFVDVAKQAGVWDRVRRAAGIEDTEKEAAE